MPDVEEYRKRLKNGKKLTDDELKNVRATLQLIAERAIDSHFERLDEESEL